MSELILWSTLHFWIYLFLCNARIKSTSIYIFFAVNFIHLFQWHKQTLKLMWIFLSFGKLFFCCDCVSSLVYIWYSLCNWLINFVRCHVILLRSQFATWKLHEELLKNNSTHTIQSTFWVQQFSDNTRWIIGWPTKILHTLKTPLRISHKLICAGILKFNGEIILNMREHCFLSLYKFRKPTLIKCDKSHHLLLLWFEWSYYCCCWWILIWRQKTRRKIKIYIRFSQTFNVLLLVTGLIRIAAVDNRLLLLITS